MHVDVRALRKTRLLSIAELLAAFREGRAADGLVTAVERVGAILARHGYGLP